MLDTVVNYLPVAWRPRAKAVIAALGALAVTLSVVLPDAPRWLTVLLAALTALGVYQTPAPGYGQDQPSDGSVDAGV